jgi:hypothetical protein
MRTHPASPVPPPSTDGGGSLYEFDEEIEVSPEDEAALAAFMAPDAGAYRQRTLADLVLERIREKQAEQGVIELPRCAWAGRRGAWFGKGA